VSEERLKIERQPSVFFNLDGQIHCRAYACARAAARKATLDVLASRERTAGRMVAALARARVHFIYMHALASHEEKRFRALLSELAREHLFISHSEAVDRVLTGRIDAPYVSFSFDDGLKSSLRAARVLDDFSAPACFFVCPLMVRDTKVATNQEVRFGNERIASAELMSWKDIDELLLRGHEVGAHTMSHPILSQLSAERLAEEVGVESRVRRWVPFLRLSRARVSCRSC
jgi:hypothetical protein